MRANLEFDLPEEQTEFSWAFYGREYHRALGELESNLRFRMKYEAEKYSEETLGVLKELRQLIRDELEGVPWD